MSEGTKYTAAEKRAIQYAYMIVSDMADMAGFSFQFEKHTKAERRECSSMIAAQALMVESFTDGHAGSLTLSEAFGLRDGCRYAALLGARLAETPHHLQAKLMGAAMDAKAAHTAALHRRMNAL